jgi:hypothetical protein
MCAQLMRQLQAAGREIDHDHPGVRSGPNTLQHAQTDDPGAHHHQHLIVLRIGQLDRVQGRGQGLGGSGLLEAQMIRNRDHSACNLRRDTQELGIAAHAHGGVTPTHLYVGHLSTNFDDLAAEFMAQNAALLQWQAQLQEQAFTIGVQVGSADAAGPNAHQRFALVEHRLWDILEANVAWAMEYGSFHEGGLLR